MPVPADCVAWCRAQDYGPVVSDDMAAVDLDQWSERLQRHHIDVRV